MGTIIQLKVVDIQLKVVDIQLKVVGTRRVPSNPDSQLL